MALQSTAISGTRLMQMIILAGNVKPAPTVGFGIGRRVGAGLSMLAKKMVCKGFKPEMMSVCYVRPAPMGDEACNLHLLYRNFLRGASSVSV